jgi:hypothetical protein
MKRFTMQKPETTEEQVSVMWDTMCNHVITHLGLLDLKINFILTLVGVLLALVGLLLAKHLV